MADTGLNVLQRLKSLANMTPTGDSYFDKRKAQIVGGEDQLAPSDLESMQTQAQLGDQGIGVSRDQVRDAGISALRQRLGLQAIQHQQEMEKVTTPQIIQGEYGVRKEVESAKAAADRLRFSTDATAKQEDLNRRSAMDRLTTSQAGQDTRQENSQQYRTDHPSGSSTTVNPALYSSVQKAQQGYEGMLSKIQRGLGGDGGRTALNSALTALLDKKGTLQEVGQVGGVLKTIPGGTIDERIQNSGIPGLQQLDPYERQYLALTLGL